MHSNSLLARTTIFACGLLLESPHYRKLVSAALDSVIAIVFEYIFNVIIVDNVGF